MTTQAEWQATIQAQWLATICTIDGCERKRHGVFHTYCRTCYERMRREKNAKLAPLGFVRGCTVTDCQGVHHATGLCRRHYNRQTTTGSTELKPKAPKPKTPRGECDADGCTALKKSPGVPYCSRHESNMKRHGVLEVGIRQGGTLIEKFARRVRGNDETGCWEWTTMTNDDEYGLFSIGNKKQMKAHRFAWEFFTGTTLTRAVQIHHECENRKCVRPAHLVPVTQGQHNTITAKLSAVPEGFHYPPNEKARSIIELGFAIDNRLPCVLNP